MINFFPSWVVTAAYVSIYIFTAALVITLAVVVVRLIRRDYLGALTLVPNYVFLLTYALGNAFKVAAVGPEFMRFHLGDIGFTAFLGLLFYGLYRATGMLNRMMDTSGLTGLDLRIKHNKAKMWFTGWAFVVSFAYEGISGYLVSELEARGGPNPGVGAFDWIDVACYALGATALIFCLYGINRQLRAEKVKVARLLQEQREAARQAKLAAGPQRKPYKKPRKPRGQR